MIHLFKFIFPIPNIGKPHPVLEYSEPTTIHLRQDLVDNLNQLILNPVIVIASSCVVHKIQNIPFCLQYLSILWIILFRLLEQPSQPIDLIDLLQTVGKIRARCYVRLGHPPVNLLHSGIDVLVIHLD